jgi:nucleoside-diphosphate-sugar epimerase
MVYERCTEYPHKEEDADDSKVMTTSYGLSKYIGERVVKSFHEQNGMKFTIWRPFNIITPFEKPEDEGFSHVFADFVRKILIEKQKPLEILGDGNQVRCFTNIFDVAEVLALYSLDSRSDNQIFNVANPEPVTMKELAYLIARLGKEYKILPKEYILWFKHLPIYQDDVRKRIPDSSKLRQTFGWEAKTKVEDSLRQCIEKFALSV